MKVKFALIIRLFLFANNNVVFSKLLNYWTYCFFRQSFTQEMAHNKNRIYKNITAHCHVKYRYMVYIRWPYLILLKWSCH